MFSNHYAIKLKINIIKQEIGIDTYALRIQLFVTPWTIVHQAPLSMGFPKQEYWSGLPFPSPRNLLTQGWNQCLLHCRQILFFFFLQADSYTVWAMGEMHI